MTNQQQAWKNYYAKKLAENPNWNRERYQIRKSRNPNEARDQSRKWWSRNRDHGNALARKRHEKNPSIKHEKDRRYYQKHEAEIVASVQEYRRNNPEKWKAHYTVKNAIRYGKLTRQPCELCGSEKTDCHHDNYDDPLEVRHLCRKHHIRLHRRIT